MSILIGQSLGRYQIIEPLGEGGMATVYKAYDTHLENEVAVKVIRTDQLPPSGLENALKRFEREAKEVAKLNHPNIVRVMDYGEHEGVPYLVMPYLHGGSLKEHLGSAMPYREAAALLLPISRALEYAHQHKMIHRDVKPSNILVTDSGEVMLTDFGIVKMLDLEGGQTLTGAGVGIGTPEYMAPEQGLGKEVDGRSDIYSLGVVFYELITGRKPFTADTPIAVVFKQLGDPLPLPSSLVTDLPEEVERVLLKALAKKPEDRYQTMGEFAKALTALEKIPSGIQPNVPGVPVILSAGDETKLEDETVTELKVNKIESKAEQPPEISAQSQRILEESKKAGEKKDVAGKPAQSKIKLKPWQLGIGIAGLILLALLILGLSGGLRGLGIKANFVSDNDGMMMVYIPKGEFTMGSPDGVGGSSEHPQHVVTLDAYWMDQTEVTNAMYAKCVNAGGCTLPSTTADYENPEFSDHPVVNVDWNKAAAYCSWAGRQLPTEAQWEKAARGTDGRTYPWGEEVDSTRANYNNTIGGTTVVGAYEAGKSPYGLFDMAGNVWEWVADYFDSGYYASQTAWSNPIGPSTGELKALRGGSWSSGAGNIRSAIRIGYGMSYADSSVGFRCAITKTK